MTKIDEAKIILKELGLPTRQQNDRSALIFLSLCNISETDQWSACNPESMTIVGGNNSRYKGIMKYIAEVFGISYAENSRESFRRQTIHQFMQAGIIVHNPDNPNLPVNSSNNHYRLVDEVRDLVKLFGTEGWDEAIENYKTKAESLAVRYAQVRNLNKLPLILEDGTELLFSPGKHNEVQIAIINEFASRFAQGADLLYVGDTEQKDLYMQKEKLQELEIPIDQHSKLPDVVLYVPEKNWLYLIEAVTSHGPVSVKRIVEIDSLLKDCPVGKIYVTAFPDFKEFKKHSNDIAWETEVWLADMPDHMIHFNGDRFMGPR